MSKYTTEVRYICAMESGLPESETEGFDKIDNVINLSVSKIFNFDFPIFDENYRLPLEKKILKHFYTREICEETVGLWKLRLCNRLNEIMPYYNQMYESQLLLSNAELLNDTDLTKSGKNDKSGKNVKNVAKDNLSETLNDTEINNEKINLYSDTPQGAMSENDLFLSTSGKTYLTNATKDRSSNQVNGDVKFTESANEAHTENISNTDEYLETIVGKSGGYNFAKRLMDLRKTFVNIDRMILDDLNGMFFGLW